MASSKKKANAAPKSERKKVVLAYSGGLDTSVAIRWLQENYDLDVVAVSIDVGQPGDMEKNIDRAKSIGSVAAYAIDAREALPRTMCGLLEPMLLPGYPLSQP